MIDNINKFDKKIYSQNGEDGIIKAIFDEIGTTNKYFVEFGCGNGTECNTRNLMDNRGWRGLLMDGLKDPPYPIREERITAENINDLFKQNNVPEEFDLLSIDIDGNDYYVWKAISDKYKPRVVIIEYNPMIRPHESRVMPYDPNWVWDSSIYYGASIRALYYLGKRKGYSLIGTNKLGVNCFFIREDLINDHFVAKNPTDAYNEPDAYLYSGHKWSDNVAPIMKDDPPYDITLETPPNVNSPKCVAVELLNNCNLTCPMCSLTTSTRKNGQIDFDLFKKIVNESKALQYPIEWFHVFGEPLMYKHFEDAMKYFYENGYGTGAVSSNGMLLTQDKIDIIIKYGRHILVSIDSAIPEIHEILRRGSKFEKVKQNIFNLIESAKGSRLRIEIQMLRTALNRNEKIDDLKAIFGTHDNVQYLDKSAIKYIGPAADFRVNTMNSNTSKCSMPYKMLAIGWNGDCVPCCFDADMRQSIGNCNDMRLDEIWKGKLAGIMRLKLKVGQLEDGDMEACRNCDQALVTGEIMP